MKRYLRRVYHRCRPVVWRFLDDRKSSTGANVKHCLFNLPLTWFNFLSSSHNKNKLFYFLLDLLLDLDRVSAYLNRQLCARDKPSVSRALRNLHQQDTDSHAARLSDKSASGPNRNRARLQLLLRPWVRSPFPFLAQQGQVHTQSLSHHGVPCHFPHFLPARNGGQAQDLGRQGAQFHRGLLHSESASRVHSRSKIQRSARFTPCAQT